MTDEVSKLPCSRKVCGEAWQEMKKTSETWVYHCISCHSIYNGSVSAHCFACKQTICEACIFTPYRLMGDYFSSNDFEYCKECYIKFIDLKRFKIQTKISHYKKKEMALGDEIYRVQTL